MDNKTRKPMVLIVDDTPANIDVLSSILTDYTVKVATNGTKALEVANRFIPDIILLDIMMPGMDGYEVCSRLKRDFRTEKIPVIFVTAMDEIADEKRGFDLGAVDYITKPVSAPIVLARIKTHMKLYDQNRALEYLVDERTKELNASRLEVIRCLGLAAEYKDNETGMHIIRMSCYCKIIAQGLGMSDEDAELLLNASPMHDVGKIGIPDHILGKPGRLTDEERIIMQKHAAIGAEIIGEHSSPLLNLARNVALTHHEKWDGSGYPQGLKGEDIPLAGRIVAIADVFDALISKRPYKEAWPVERAIAQIKEDSGQHFDPKLVSVFLENVDKILELAEKHADPE